jgi:hypothetical protein
MLAPFPAQAADWPDTQHDSRVGAFVGIRLQLRSGGPDGGRARTSFAIAPTRSTNSTSGEIRTRIGEGLALEFSGREAPRATLAGVPFRQNLGLTREDGAPANNRKLGVSTGGWVAIGVGVAAVAGAAIFVNAVTSCEEHDDEC